MTGFCDKIDQSCDITNSLNIGISILDDKLRIIYVNSVLRDKFQLPRDVKGKYCYEIYHGRSTTCENCLSYRALTLGAIESGIYERKDSTGQNRFFQLIAAPIKDDEGKIIQVLEVIIDITDARNLSQKLSESEAFYRTLFDHSGTAVVVVEDNKIISRANKKFEELTGYKKEEIESKLTTLHFVREDEREQVSKIHEIRRSDPKSAPAWYQVHLIHKTGTARLVEVHADTVPNSKISIASLIDITEKRRLEKKVSEKDQLLRNIVENSADAIIYVDLENIIRAWNKGAQNIFEYTEEEILGKPFAILIPNDVDKHEEFAVLKDVLSRQGYIKGFETTRVSKSGKEIVCNVSWTHTKNIYGKVIGSAAIIRDITEEKILLERVLYNERLGALGEVAASLAHEIKNPLNSMIINFEVLKGSIEKVPTELKDSFNKYSRVIESEIIRLDKVIRGFLDFAKPVKFETKKIDVIKIINNTSDLIRHQASKQHITINKIFNSADLFIGGDEDQLKQALLNLMLNGIQAMNEGGELKIDAGKSVCGDFIYIFVSDTGCGIKSENLDKVFELYYTTKDKGSGFGLPIVKRIINFHQGTIKLESEENKGAKFTLKFPTWKEN